MERAASVAGASVRALDLADSLIPAGADVLELGCGAGMPMTARLAAGRRLTGIDVSAEQIRRARRNVPGATFEVADMTTSDATPGEPRRRRRVLLAHPRPARRAARCCSAAIREWLRPGGLFIASLGVEDDPGGVEDDWLGVHDVLQPLLGPGEPAAPGGGGVRRGARGGGRRAGGPPRRAVPLGRGPGARRMSAEYEPGHRRPEGLDEPDEIPAGPPAGSTATAGDPDDDPSRIFWLIGGALAIAAGTALGWDATALATVVTPPPLHPRRAHRRLGRRSASSC